MKKLFILALVLFCFNNANASHFMGGEITWVCIKDASSPDFGKYIFTLKIEMFIDNRLVNIKKT